MILSLLFVVSFLTLSSVSGQGIRSNETSKKWEILCGLCKEILVDKDTLHKRETADESVDFVCNGQLWMVGLIERCAKLLTGRDKSSYLSSSDDVRDFLGNFRILENAAQASTGESSSPPATPSLVDHQKRRYAYISLPKRSGIDPLYGISLGKK